MRKLSKYLKPFWLSILLVVGFLFIQAQSELALPGYMSNIVDSGIQHSGINDAAMSAMRSDTMDKLSILMDEEDVSVLKGNYTLVNQGDEDYLSEYPVLSNEAIYVLNDVNDEVKGEISQILSKPLLINSMLQQEDILTSFNLSSIDEAYMLIEAQPTLLEQIDEAIDLQFTTSEAITSAAIMGVKSEYMAMGVDLNQIQFNYIISAGLMMLGIALLSAMSAVIVGFLASKVAAGVARNLREKVFAKVETFSSYEFNKFSTASLITRTTNDIQQIQMMITMVLRVVIFAPIMGIGAMINVFNTNVSMLWIIALVIAILICIIGVLFKIATPRFKKIQRLVDKINLVMREFLSGMLVIRAFNTEKHEEERFDNANNDITKNNLFVNRLMSALNPIMTFLMNAVSILIVWIGASYIDLGTLQIGDMMAFMQYTMQILMSFIMISVISIMLPQASVSIGRILEVIDCEISIQDVENPKEFKDIQGEIEFNHVYFKYPGSEAYVLEDISFVAKPGKTTAFIGSTGSGKSTLINLVPRFFDTTKGTITIDGINISEVKQFDLREQIGYVPQKAVLFSGDIESNLRYAKENATLEELEEAIEISQSKEFISKKEEGINSSISQGGTNVSGGQKQRLSIARALAKQPQIYIFDDSFSALDFKTDALLRGAINEMIEKTKNTVLIVGQRISTIMDADQIVVLDDGKIVGMGKHQELLQTCSVYKEIAYSQLSKEELENE